MIKYEAIGERDQISIEMLDLNKQILIVKDISFARAFMDPGARFSFQITGQKMIELYPQLQDGQRLGLRINNNLVCTGILDTLRLEQGSSGTTLHVQGEDAISIAAGRTMDPSFQIDEKIPLKDLLIKLFSPLGFTNIEFDNSVDQRRMTGSDKDFALDTKYQVIEKAMTSPINSKFKPSRSEGVYEFAERIGRRFGFHVYGGTDGKTLFIGQPNYNQPPLYTFLVFQGEKSKSNNVISCTSNISWKKQPSALIVSGKGGGGKKAKNALRVMMYNELLTGVEDIPELKAIEEKYKGMIVIKKRSQVQRPNNVVPLTKYVKPIYEEDNQSLTPEQLENFTRRRMGEYQSEFLTMTVEVDGASQNGINYMPNTMCYMDNDMANIHQLMYIKSVTIRAGSSGTRTTLELTLPYTFELTSSEKLKPKPSATQKTVAAFTETRGDIPQYT